MKFSIVTPSFNQGQFIERTLSSVASQSGADIEHVVFDGGSTDNTVKVLEGFDAPIRWASEKDKGQTDAVNKGIRATDGDIIGWLNSDDIYYPGTIEIVARHFAEHPNCNLVYGDADHIDVNDAAFEAYPTEAWDFERLKQTCFICQPTVFFRRRLVEKIGLLDESLNYCMDYEYWLRLGKNGVYFQHLPHKLAGSRLYGETKTLGARIKVHREINDMMKRTLGQVPDRWLANYAHAIVESRVNRENEPRRFVRSVGVRTALAALRWNHRVSPAMRVEIRHWFANI